MKVAAITISDAERPSINVRLENGNTIGSFPFPESMNVRKIATILRKLAREITLAK